MKSIAAFNIVNGFTLLILGATTEEPGRAICYHIAGFLIAFTGVRQAIDLVGRKEPL